MAVGVSYPADMIDGNGFVSKGATIQFLSSTNQPAQAGAELVGTDVSLTGLTGAVTAVRYVGGTATVAPTTGTFAVGDFVISVNGSLWVCTVAGSPGTWVQGGSVLLAPKASPTFTGTAAAAALTSSGNTSLATAGTLAFYNHAGAAQQSVTGALSTVADAPAKAVLTSILNALVATGLVTNGTT